jgi:hypothetical protein
MTAPAEVAPDAADGAAGAEPAPARVGDHREAPFSIVLHDAGEGISLVAAAPLTPADQARVRRAVRDYADRLGLAVRAFHLNGWAGDGSTPVRRDRHGG